MPRQQLIQFRKDITGAAVAPPAVASGTDGEPFWSLGGITGLSHTVAGNDLMVHTGTGFAPLISPTRQVELIGAQTITGAKTFSLASLLITGGTAGQVLSATGVGGGLQWMTPGAGGTTYTFGRGLTEAPPGTVDLDIAGNTIAALGGIFVPAPGAGNGLVLAGGQLTLATATGAQLGGVTVLPNGGLAQTGAAVRTDPATQAEATAGTDNAKPITALVLKLGADPATLSTTAKSLVPAINELASIITAATGLLTLVGTYNATTGNVTPITGSPLGAGPLPAASAATVGYFLLVSVAGTPPPPAPNTPMIVNDMLIGVEAPPGSSTYAWAHVSLGQAVVAASNVSVTVIPGITANNVQDAIAELQVGKLDAPLYIDQSLSGDGGSPASALAVAVVDGGTF